jgi:phage-related protein
MLQDIAYFVDDRGQNPVKEFIDELPKREQAKIFAYLDELMAQGHNLRRPMADYLRDGIYELRPKDNRIFYFFFMKNRAILLHAIKKHSDKILVNDLQLCLKRRNIVENDGRVEKL